MAVSQADLSRLDAILRDRPIQDAIQEAMNKATPLAERITQQLTLSGRQGIFPVSFGVNEGVYARADKGAWGDSVVDQPLLASVKAKFLYAVFEISGPVMSASRDEYAFEDALSLQLENTVDGVKLEMARMILGKGDGVTALVNSRVSATQIVVEKPFGLSTFKSSVPVKNMIRKGMNFDVGPSAAVPASKYSNSGVTAIVHSSTLTTIDLNPAELVAPVSGDLVTHSGNATKEITGFFGAVDTAGSYLGITRAGNPGWQGTLTDVTAGGAATIDLDPDMLRDQVDTIVEASGKTPDLIVCNYKQRRNIYNLYAPQIRYAPMVLPAGLREGTLAYDDISVLAERFFPPQHIGFFNVGTWYHAIDKDVEWIQGLNGSVLHFTLTADVFRAILRTYREIVNLFPAANGFIYGVSE